MIIVGSEEKIHITMLSECLLFREGAVKNGEKKGFHGKRQGRCI